MRAHLRFKLERGTYSDADKEFVEVDVTIAVSVEEGHEAVSLSAGNADLDLAETAPELFAVNLTVAIEGVEVAEGTAETTDSLSTAGLNLSANLFED